MEDTTMQSPEDERPGNVSNISNVSNVSNISNVSNVSNVPIVEIEVFEFESRAAWPCGPWT